MEQFLDNLILSLNSIEVKGEKNMDILLGCILAVKKLKAEIVKPEEEKGEEDG